MEGSEGRVHALNRPQGQLTRLCDQAFEGDGPSCRAEHPPARIDP